MVLDAKDCVWLGFGLVRVWPGQGLARVICCSVATDLKNQNVLNM